MISSRVNKRGLQVKQSITRHLDGLVCLTYCYRSEILHDRLIVGGYVLYVQYFCSNAVGWFERRENMH